MFCRSAPERFAAGTHTSDAASGAVSRKADELLSYDRNTSAEKVVKPPRECLHHFFSVANLSGALRQGFLAKDTLRNDLIVHGGRLNCSSTMPVRRGVRVAWSISRSIPWVLPKPKMWTRSMAPTPNNCGYHIHRRMVGFIPHISVMFYIRTLRGFTEIALTSGALPGEGTRRTKTLSEWLP